MFLRWSDELDTGIPEIDAQHRKIVDYINQLAQARTNRDRSVAWQILRDLVQYTKAHFAYEEHLQAKADYENAKLHKEVHSFFTKRIARYEERYLHGEDVVEPLHTMLRAWLIHHIKQDDAAYVPALTIKIERLAPPAVRASWFERTLGAFFPS